MNDKIKSFIYLICFIAVIVFIVIVVTQVQDKKRREENKLYRQLNDVVQTYYKDYYYKVVLGSDDETRKNNAANLSKTGIKMTLEELANYKAEDKDRILNGFKNYKTNLPCDYKNTVIIIYPNEPYGEDNIKIDSTIECGI